MDKSLINASILFYRHSGFLTRAAGERQDAVALKAPEGHRYPPHEYVEHHGPALVDSSSRINVLAGVPRSSLTLVRFYLISPPYRRSSYM